jgi:TM2 domain-containing membrane protein YozV
VTAPNDDWQQRIENGQPFHPTADEAVTAAYPTPDAPNPTPGYPAYAPAPAPAPGPVYGPQGSGPGYPPPPQPPTAGAEQPYGAQPPQPGQYGAQPGYPAQYPQQFAAAPGYGYPGADASAPYGRDPVTGEPLSDKTKVAAGLLQIFLGAFGVGRFYTGHTGIAIGQIAVTWLTCGFGAIWPLIDGIIMLAGNVRDAQGRKLRS